jgi:hypothetical protein
MARREREILEHAVHTIAEQAAKADDLVDEAKAAGGGDHPLPVHVDRGDRHWRVQPGRRALL